MAADFSRAGQLKDQKSGIAKGTDVRMKLTALRCTKCGADIVTYDPKSAVARCDALGCGATFVVDQGRAFAKLDAMKASAIVSLRATLPLYLKKRDFARASGVAESILELVPEDFLARFYLHLSGKYVSDAREYRAFIACPGKATQEEYEEAFGVMLSCLEPVETDYARDLSGGRTYPRTSAVAGKNA